MTMERVRKLATKRQEKSAPLQEPGKKDTYLVLEVFKDTTFLTRQAQAQEQKTNRSPMDTIAAPAPQGKGSLF